MDDLPLSDLMPPREAQQALPFSPLKTLPGPPTKPGWYWLSDDRVSRGIMVRVMLIDGQLKVRLYFRDDVPVTEAKGFWRGPLRSSTGPLNE